MLDTSILTVDNSLVSKLIKTISFNPVKITDK